MIEKCTFSTPPLSLQIAWKPMNPFKTFRGISSFTSPNFSSLMSYRISVFYSEHIFPFIFSISSPSSSHLPAMHRTSIFCTDPLFISTVRLSEHLSVCHHHLVLLLFFMLRRRSRAFLNSISYPKDRNVRSLKAHFIVTQPSEIICFNI